MFKVPVPQAHMQLRSLLPLLLPSPTLPLGLGLALALGPFPKRTLLLSPFDENHEQCMRSSPDKPLAHRAATAVPAQRRVMHRAMLVAVRNVPISVCAASPGEYLQGKKHAYNIR
eukprot:5594276-Pleurochrysis_carterae.AAC.3